MATDSDDLLQLYDSEGCCCDVQGPMHHESHVQILADAKDPPTRSVTLTRMQLDMTTHEHLALRQDASSTYAGSLLQVRFMVKDIKLPSPAAHVVGTSLLVSHAFCSGLPSGTKLHR